MHIDGARQRDTFNGELLLVNAKARQTGKRQSDQRDESDNEA